MAVENNEGGDALIPLNLRVPAALKARWVRESRAEGKKLAAWIIERVEREENKMNVYKIPESLADAYHGAGWALAAISGGQVVALRYIVDVAPPAVADAMTEAEGAHARFFVRHWMVTQEAAPVVRELQALGEVSVGMCGAWEFVGL